MDATPETTQVRQDPQLEQLLDELEETLAQYNNIRCQVTSAQYCFEQIPGRTFSSVGLNTEMSKRRLMVKHHLEEAWLELYGIRDALTRFKVRQELESK